MSVAEIMPPSFGPAEAAARLATFRHFVEHFVRPTPGEYTQLLALLHEQVYPRHSLLLEAGQLCDQIFFLTQGIVRHVYRHHDGEGTTWFSQAGDVMTDPTSFFQAEPRQPSPASLLAATDVRAFSLTRADLLALYAQSPTWERFGRLVNEQYLLALSERALGLQFNSARERYEELLARQPTLFLHIPLVHIASYLGMAPETLSRLRAE